MKQYLTEKQMQQLVDLGISCSDASFKIISKYPSSDCDYNEKNENISGKSIVSKYFPSKLYNEYGYIYSLADIIGKLPKAITVDGHDYALEISLSTNKEDFLKKWSIDYGNGNKLLFIFAEDELIDAAFKTLIKYYKTNEYV